MLMSSKRWEPRANPDLDRELEEPLRTTFLVALLSAGTTLFASPITGLFNTGVNASGIPLVGANVSDPNYVITSSPGAGVSNITPVTFNCCYFADGPNSRWISVNANGSNAGSGTYVFELTFSLAGLDPASAVITGQFAADNQSTIQMNGVTVPGIANTFSIYTPFTINSNFIAGSNKLAFVVVDAGAPMALRVDSLAGTANPLSEVPEPSTVGLILSGLVAMSARQFRKR